MYYNAAQNDRKRRQSAMIKTVVVTILLALALLGPEILPDAIMEFFQDSPATPEDGAQASA